MLVITAVAVATTTRLAAQRGYSVCISYVRNSEAAEFVTEEIRRAGGKALAVKADVSSQEDVASLFDTATNFLGPLGALVNNAGIVEKQARVENMDPARLARGFAVNITGAFLCAREAVRRMSVKHAGRGGAIVNVSSVVARLGAPDEYVAFAAAKAAIDTMTIGKRSRSRRHTG